MHTNIRTNFIHKYMKNPTDSHSNDLLEDFRRLLTAAIQTKWEQLQVGFGCTTLKSSLVTSLYIFPF